MRDFLIVLANFLLYITLAVLSIPLGVTVLVVCLLIVGLVIVVGLPIAIAIGLFELSVYALYMLKRISK